MISNFHQILKERFANANLAQVSKEIDVPRSVLQNWIVEERFPTMNVKSLGYLKRLANYLNLTLDELLSEGSTQKTISSVVFEDGNRKYQINIQRLK